MIGSGRVCLRKRRADRRLSEAALRMPESTLAGEVPVASPDIENDVICSACDTVRHVIEVQCLARFPRDDVIGTGRVAAHPYGADERPCGVVEREATSEYIYTADLAAEHRIFGGSVELSVPSVSHRHVDRIALL